MTHQRHFQSLSLPGLSKIFHMPYQRSLLVSFLLICSIIAHAQQTPDSSKVLEAVQVTARKRLYEQKPEGLIVNPQSSLLTRGSSVLELLERAPGVMIDRRNGSINFRGKADVLVLLNGRPINLSPEQTVTMLNGMSGTEVIRIELLDSPPAGYDAQGTAGVINIVTGRIRRPGTNGTATLSAGVGWAEKIAANLNLAHNSKRLKIYGSFSGTNDRSYSEMLVASRQDMPVFGGGLSVLVTDTARSKRQNFDAVLGTDFQLTKKTTVGYSLQWNRSIGSSRNNTHSDFILLPDSLLFFRGQINGQNRWNNFLHDLYLEKQVREGEKLFIDFNYMRFNNTSPSIVASSFQDRNSEPVRTNDSLFAPEQRGAANTRISIGVAKIDYEKRSRERWLWQAGAKVANTHTSSTSGIESLINGSWSPRRETMNRAIMHEKTAALYASSNVKLDSATTLTAGFRYEYWAVNVYDPIAKQDLIRRFEGGIFPNISFTKKLNRRNELQLSFSSRVGRPSYNDLASFVRYSDPTAVYAGNTLLRSSRSHQLKIALNHKRYHAFVSLGHEKNPIARYQLAESRERNLLLVAPQNLQYLNNISLQVILPVTVASWWTMAYTLIGDAREFKLAHTLIRARKTYFTYSANFSQSFVLPHKFSMELSGWLNGRFYNGSIKVGRMGALNMGVKKQFNKNHGSLQLSVADIFSTMHINTYYGTVTREAFSIQNHVSIDLESARSPIVKLTYSRSFGKESVTTSPKKMEEKGRVEY
jgi:hypothetical protein